MDGWGFAASDYIRAISTTSVDLVCRPIFLGSSIGPCPRDIVEYENKKFDGHPDVVVQNCLPQFMEYQPNCKNVGLLYLETDGWEGSGWTSKLNLMDEIWVSSSIEKNILKNNRVTTPIKKIGMPINNKQFTNIGTTPLPNSDAFSFYFIGEYIERKNIRSLLIAFHREFNKNDNVQLVLKLNRGGMQPTLLLQKVTEDVNKLKSQMRIYHDPSLYHSEYVITDYMSKEELLGLHLGCDCLVYPSRGESLNRSVMDAVNAGNNIIVTANTGMEDIVNEYHGVAVSSHKIPVITSEPPLRDIYTARETWREIDILELQKAMRNAYNLGKSKHVINEMKNHTYEAIGKEIIDECNN